MSPMSNEKERQAYYRRKLAGQCVRCHQPSRPGRTFCVGCAEKHGKKRDERFRRHREEGLCRCGRERAEGRTKCRACLDHHKARQRPLIASAARRSKRDRERARIFAAYGARCACCGETEDAFLCVDHVQNNGASERRRWPNRSNAKMAIASGFSADYQILCANCNHAKALLGKCPHQTPASPDMVELSAAETRS